jgi:hypothetical protein
MTPVTKHPSVVILGAGVVGLCTAKRFHLCDLWRSVSICVEWILTRMSTDALRSH